MKIGIVGSGFVGASAAFAIVMRGVGREVVLVDKNRARAEAEADDIRHAVPFAHAMEVSSGDYADLANCRAVVVCAGVGQKPGENRLQLLQRNAEVFADVIPQIIKHAPDAVLIIASNPVDAMTHLAAHYAAKCGAPAGRVFGSGTTLDTARFRSLLANYCGVDSHHVHGYVIGEHGDSEVLTWSLVTVGGMPLSEFAKLRGLQAIETVRDGVDRQVRNAAYSIISGKGATYYGIGSALARIVEAVVNDQRAILTVTLPTSEVEGVNNACVALPRLVGGDGVLETFPLPLSAEEAGQLSASARVVRAAMDEIGIV
jgi:L-lactate dehydrogenase